MSTAIHSEITDYLRSKYDIELVEICNLELGNNDIQHFLSFTFLCSSNYNPKLIANYYLLNDRIQVGFSCGKDTRKVMLNYHKILMDEVFPHWFPSLQLTFKFMPLSFPGWYADYKE